MSAPVLAPGTVVGGRYTVGSAIGRGARSTTYRASSSEVASEVALKVYDGGLPPSVLDAMRSAAEAAAGMTSAAIATLDAGIDPASGAAFAVQELSARPSLAQLVELCPLAHADAIALVRSLARALAPLHERGVAHGALAPGNVFVGPPPACDVRLSDFVAPAAGQSAAAAVAADVRGAARAVYFALTGRALGAAGPEPADAWSAVLGRALQAQGGASYASLDALADALEGAGRGEAPKPLLAAPVSWPVAAPAKAAPEARRAPARRPLRWMGAGVASCLVLATFAVLVLKLATRAAVAAAPSAAPVASAPASADAPLASAPPTAPLPEPPAEPSASVAAAVEPPPAPEPKIPARDHTHGMLVVRCSPSCDAVYMDGRAVGYPDRGKLLAPGMHVVGAKLAGHASQVKRVLVRRGRVQKLDLVF